MEKRIEKKITDEKIKNLSSGGKFILDQIPVKKFYDQALHLEKIILPKIAETRGRDSADYVFFSEVYKSLLYAVLILDRGESLILKIQHLKQFNQVLQERADVAEKYLSRYMAMEDLYFYDGLDKIAADVKNRVENILNK
jgi:hypothetical protein